MAVKKTVRPNQRNNNKNNYYNFKEDNNLKDVDAIKKYEQYLNSERNYSTYTVDNYIRDITDFRDFLQQESFGTLLSATSTQARNYVTRLFNEDYKRKTIARKLSSLKTFYRYLVSEEIIKDNPFEMIESPKVEKSLPKFLYVEEIEQIFNSVDTTTALGKRNIAILEILYGSGLRVSELCNLRIDGIKEALLIKWKGRKYRNVYLFEKHLNMLWDYISLCISKGIKSEYVFISLSKNSVWKKLSRNSVERVVKEAWKDAGLNSPVFPHKLRHTFATQLLKKNVDLMSIKELMGHSSILTTQTYLSLESEELKNAQWNLQDFGINPDNLPDTEYQTIAWFIKNKPDLFNIWKYNPMNQMYGSEVNSLSWF